MVLMTFCLCLLPERVIWRASISECYSRDSRSWTSRRKTYFAWSSPVSVMTWVGNKITRSHHRVSLFQNSKIQIKDDFIITILKDKLLPRLEKQTVLVWLEIRCLVSSNQWSCQNFSRKRREKSHYWYLDYSLWNPSVAIILSTPLHADSIGHGWLTCISNYWRYEAYIVCVQYISVNFLFHRSRAIFTCLGKTVHGCGETWEQIRGRTQSTKYCTNAYQNFALFY